MSITKDQIQSMRTILLFFFGVMILASCEKVSKGEARMLRNCTGTYLKTGAKEYKVCNLERTDPVADDATVKVKFKKIGTCKGTASRRSACEMAYPYESWVEVLKIE